ncbi:hypothetical protein WG902_12150 [Ramlibacter sp. PS3R-8]|uniref:hypothetical protein n=1 Tax=Ramlibacter sp. PS3R-8 TaxID=3133437 RepID=UPI0030B166F8
MKRVLLLAAILSSATFLVSCGGGGGEDSTMVAAENFEASVDATNGAKLFKALVGESFTYDNGVPDFETTTATQVDIVDAPANAEGLGFRISSDGNEATGSLEFGSCIFRITGSNYPSRLVVGTFKRVRDCRIRLNTAGALADGTVKRLPITVTLRGRSVTKLVNVRIAANGTILINSVLFGECKVRPITGTTGGA